MPPKLSAHNVGGGNWELRVYDGFPSHCTSATYALFGHLVALLHNGGKIHLTAEPRLRVLEVKRQMPDGTQLVDGQGPVVDFQCQRRRRRPPCSSTPAPA